MRGRSRVKLNRERGETAMPKEQDKQVVSDKLLADIRNHLMGSPSANELQSIQLQMDVLNRWARLALEDAASNDHDHAMATDHNDHDHAAARE
jgi:hypothetical protein